VTSHGSRFPHTHGPPKQRGVRAVPVGVVIIMRITERCLGKNVIYMLNAADGTYGWRCQWHEVDVEPVDGVKLVCFCDPCAFLPIDNITSYQYKDCLEDKREDYQNCSMLYCVQSFACMSSSYRWTRRHSRSTIPHHIAVVSQMCTGIGVLVISVKMHLLTLWPWPLPFQPQTTSLLGYPKVIPCIKFERFGVIRFWVMLRTNRQTDRRRRTCYPRRPTVSVGKRLEYVNYGLGSCWGLCVSRAFSIFN